MKERLHLLFIDTYRLGAQAFESSYHDQARWIIYALLFALDRYPILHDGRRRDALSKMAVILRELGHQWEYEHVLEIASNIHNAVSPLPEEDPCLLLAASLPKTSEETKRVQENLWRETSVTNDVPHDLVYPAIHRAAQIRNGGVVATHLAHNHGIDRTLAIDNQQRSRVAKYLNITSDFVQARLEVDARNRCKRTALFLAAAQGLYQCCLSLIAALADPNTRDEHGHTILEVACKGGHLEVAKLLVGVGADINPQLMWCTSSPLQAAIESEKFSNKLVHFLIERGAYFTVQRLADGKTAIDIADDGGYSELADTMRFQHGGPSLFGLDMSYQSFDQAWYPRE